MRRDEDSGDQLRKAGMSWADKRRHETQGIINGNGMRLEELQRKAAMR